MKNTGALIKYIAICFAIILICSLISGIGNLLINTFTTNDEHIVIEEEIINSNVSKIDVNLISSDINIVKGEYFKAESNNDNIEIRQNNNILYIKENKSLFKSNEEITIYIPYGMLFDNVIINNERGNINIESLNSESLDIELDMGRVDISNSSVNSMCNIETGVGSANIVSSIINNLDLETGLGKTYIFSRINGNSKIENGIGSLVLDLVGDSEYKIKAEKGIGTLFINNNRITDSKYTYGKGNNIISIDTGIGSAKVNFK